MNTQPTLPLHIVVLAAGEGRRMNSRRPKVLQPLAGRPMLSHVLDAARALSPTAIHVVYGHAGDQLQAAFADDDIHWVRQAEQLGTGHAVQQAMPDIADGARVLVLYGDVPLLTPETLLPLLDNGNTRPERLSVLVAELDDPSGYGRIVTGDDGRVCAIVEQRDTTPAQAAIHIVNTGIICATAADLRRWLAGIDSGNAQGEFYLTDIFALAAADGAPARAVAIADANEASGANDALQLAVLERLYRQRAVRGLMRQGVRLADPDRLDLRGMLQAGRDVELDVNVILEGSVELGDDVRIGPFTRLRNCRLASGTVVDAHCDLDGVITTGPCHIGPFARLRPGTELAEGARIGNFVETKNTRLAAGSKANHLTYLGDADIGERVNIGAGTITCNYDGASKNRTRIGNDAFVGSNTSLVAPIEVGEGATIGAGSTVTRNAPAKALTVARAKATVIEGWQRPKKARPTS